MSGIFGRPCGAPGAIFAKLKLREAEEAPRAIEVVLLDSQARIRQDLRTVEEVPQSTEGHNGLAKQFHEAQQGHK